LLLSAAINKVIIEHIYKRSNFKLYAVNIENRYFASWISG